jgi:hypothetical protein
MKRNVLSTVGFLLFTIASTAQVSVSSSVSKTDKSQQEFSMPVASPKVTTTQQFSTSSIGLEYSRPSMKGRKIFGNMIAFGKPWRTGANAATKITFGEEIMFGGQTIKPGTYALYTIPQKDSWIVLLNTNHKSSGLNDIKPENDIAKVEVKPRQLSQSVETFTIEINEITSTSASLDIMWENTKVSVPIVANNQERILAHLDKALQGENPPYRDAAYYLEEIGKDLPRAIEYADKALEANPKAFWIHSLKARIYSKMGDKKQALRSAEMAAELTTGTDYEEEYRKKAQEYK